MIPRMTDSQFRKVRRLIRRLCANFDGGNCLLLDDGYEPCPCPQLISYSVLCKYFRAAVLPADEALCLEILNSDSRRRCLDCNQPFAAQSPNTLYCSPCAQRRKRLSKREWARRNKGTQ